MSITADVQRGAFVRPVLAALWSFWTEGRRIERVCYLIGAALIASGLSHLAVFAVDGGPWEGPVSWRKPTTFGLSFGTNTTESRRTRVIAWTTVAYAAAIVIAGIYSLTRAFAG
jgi:hypothetical protein